MKRIATAADHASRAKSINRRDTVFLAVTAIVGIDVVVLLIDVGGAQTLTWAIVVATTFVFPYSLIVAELGTSFTGDGGPYSWLRLAFGRFVAAVATMFYWVTNPIWIGGSLAFLSEATCATFLGGLPPNSVAGYVFRFVFVWLSIAAATVSLRLGRRIMAAGAAAKVAVLVVFVATVAMNALSLGLPADSAVDPAPTAAGFLATTPILLFALVGLEAPSGAVSEMEDPARDVPSAVAASAGISLACYTIPVLVFVALVPPAQRQTAQGFLDALHKLVDVYGGAAPAVLLAAALLFTFAALTQGSAWMITANRMQAAAAADGGFPRRFGQLSATTGAPVRVNLLSGWIATVFTIAAAQMNIGGAAIFKVVLTTAMSTLLLSYLAIVPAIVQLRRRHPDVPRPYRVPGGRWGLYSCTALVWCWAAVGGWLTVFPGTLEGLVGIRYDFTARWGVSRMTYEVFTLGTLLTIAVIAVSGYASAGFQQRVARDAARPSGND